MKYRKILVACLLVSMLTACSSISKNDADAVVATLSNTTDTSVTEISTTTVTEISTTSATDVSTTSATDVSTPRTVTNNSEIIFNNAIDLPMKHYEAGTNILGEAYDAYDTYDVAALIENTLYNVVTLNDGSKVYGLLQAGAIEHTENMTYVASGKKLQTVYVQCANGSVNEYTQDWFVRWSASNGSPNYAPVEITLCDIDNDDIDELLFMQRATGMFAQCYSELAVLELSDNSNTVFDGVKQDTLINENISVTVDASVSKLNITAYGETFEYAIDSELATYTENPQPDSGHIYFEIADDTVYAYLGIRCGMMPLVPCYIRLQLTYNNGIFAFTEPSVIPFSESRFA